MLDDRVNLARADHQGAEDILGEPGEGEDLLDLQGAAGDVGRMFQQPGISGHEGRGGEAEDLPEGEVPRHDGKDDAQGTMGDVGFAGVAGNNLVGKKILGVVGIEITASGAFVDLGPPLNNRLAHLQRHGAGVTVGVGA